MVMAEGKLLNRLDIVDSDRGSEGIIKFNISFTIPPIAKIATNPDIKVIM